MAFITYLGLQMVLLINGVKGIYLTILQQSHLIMITYTMIHFKLKNLKPVMTKITNLLVDSDHCQAVLTA